MRRFYFLFFFILLRPALSFPDTIELKNKQVIEGEIIEETEYYLEVDIQGKAMSYYKDEIDSIRKDAPLYHQNPLGEIVRIAGYKFMRDEVLISIEGLDYLDNFPEDLVDFEEAVRSFKFRSD